MDNKKKDLKEEKIEEREIQKKVVSTENSNQEIEEPEILKKLPPEIKKVVEMGFSMQRISGPMQNPLLSKLNENHINRILDIGEKEEENIFKDSQSNKKYNLIYFILGILLFVFLVIFLGKDNKDLFLEILKVGILLIGGFGGGFGYKTFIDKKKSL